jgi:hypothetical protein
LELVALVRRHLPGPELPAVIQIPHPDRTLLSLAGVSQPKPLSVVAVVCQTLPPETEGLVVAVAAAPGFLGQEPRVKASTGLLATIQEVTAITPVALAVALAVQAAQ